MKRSAFIILLISLPLLISSCSNELDYSNSWIEYYTYHDFERNNGQDVEGDTIFTPFTTIDQPLFLRIKTQSNSGGEPRFFRTIDDGERKDITVEVPMGGFYEHDNGTTKHVKEIKIMIPSNLFSEEQIIKYETSIDTESGTLTKAVYVVIKNN